MEKRFSSIFHNFIAIKFDSHPWNGLMGKSFTFHNRNRAFSLPLTINLFVVLPRHPKTTKAPSQANISDSKATQMAFESWVVRFIGEALTVKSERDLLISSFPPHCWGNFRLWGRWRRNLTWSAESSKVWRMQIWFPSAIELFRKNLFEWMIIR